MSNKVFIGKISSRVKEADLDAIFSKSGKIDRITIKAGFAFIEYLDPKDAADAVKQFDGYRLDGDRVTVEFAKDSALSPVAMEPRRPTPSAYPSSPPTLPMTDRYSSSDMSRDYRPRDREEPYMSNELPRSNSRYVEEERYRDRYVERGRGSDSRSPYDSRLDYREPFRDSRHYGDERYADRHHPYDSYSRRDMRYDMPVHSRDRYSSHHNNYDRESGRYDDYRTSARNDYRDYNAPIEPRYAHRAAPTEVDRYSSQYDAPRDYDRDRRRPYDMKEPMESGRHAVNCFNCNQLGHYARECPQHNPRRDGNRRSASPAPSRGRSGRSLSPKNLKQPVMSEKSENDLSVSNTGLLETGVSPSEKSPSSDVLSNVADKRNVAELDKDDDNLMRSPSPVAHYD